MSRVFAWSSLVLVSMLIAWPATTSAQTSVRGGQFRRQQIDDDTLNRAGRLEFGVNLAGGMSFGTATVGDRTESLRNIYVAPGLVAGYMATDNFEVRLLLGGQVTNQTVGDTTLNDTWAFNGVLQGLYQRDLILGLAWYAGIGVGGFYGSRFKPDQAGIERRHTNLGGVGQLLGGLLLQPGPRLILRGGVRADFLFGSESLADGSAESTGFFTSQIYFDLGIGVRI